MNRYELYMGSYYLRDERGNIVYACDALAFAYSDQDGSFVLHRHGEPAYVSAWIQNNREKASGMFGELKMLTLDKRIPVEDINRCLENSGYLGTFIAEWSQAE